MEEVYKKIKNGNQLVKKVNLNLEDIQLLDEHEFGNYIIFNKTFRLDPEEYKEIKNRWISLIKNQ